MNNKHHQYFILLGFAICFLLTSLFACSSQQNSQSQNNKVGLAVYQKYCFSCHGADGKLGLNQAPDLTSSTLPQQEVIQQIKKGKGMMQAYEKMLSTEEITSVADYIMHFRTK